MGEPGGSYAEYAIAWDYTTFHIPASISFEGTFLALVEAFGEPLTHIIEAATIPLAALTAVMALYHNLKLPTPWSPATAPLPLVVYGASTAVGAFALKLAKNSNIHPIIAIAGNGKDYVETLVDRSKGDIVVDYREGNDAMISQIRNHLKKGGYGEPQHGLDPGIGVHSKKVLDEIVAADGAINLVLPSNWSTVSAVKTTTSVGISHGADRATWEGNASNLAFVFSRWFTRGLQLGNFQGHPFEIRSNGLEGVEQALKDLKDGKASAVKYVFRIRDTPSI